MCVPHSWLPGQVEEEEEANEGDWTREGEKETARGFVSLEREGIADVCMYVYAAKQKKKKKVKLREGEWESGARRKEKREKQIKKEGKGESDVR